MAFVCSEALAIVREPCVDNVVFCYREEQVAFQVELDLCERTLVTREKNRPLVVDDKSEMKCRYFGQICRYASD